MPRVFNVILLVAILSMPIALAAQRRGGGGGAHVQVVRPQGQFVVRAPAPVVGVPFAHAPIAPPVVVVRPHRSFNVVPQFGFGFGYYSPYVWPAPIVSAPIVGQVYSEPAYSAQTQTAPQPPPVSQNEIELSYQVGRLSQEIEQLRQQQAQARVEPPAPAAPSIPTVLVFRDGHRMEVSNYAVVGQTLWVLDERTSVKISLADLDLEATQRENRQRGVRFLLR